MFQGGGFSPPPFSDLLVSESKRKTQMSSDNPTEGATESATPTKSATATKPTGKALAKTAAPALMRVKMTTSQAGFHQVPVVDAAGNPIYNENGTPKTRNGHEFVRNPNQEYEMPVSEAERLIDHGYAVTVG